MNIAERLDGTLRSVCPIHGVSIGHPSNKSTWRIHFKDEATEPQRAAAQAALDAFDPAAPEPVAVPKEVTMRQARLALAGAGLLANVNAAVEALPEPQRSAARIEWEYSATVQRNKGLTQSLAASLGLTNAQLDALFTQASTL